MQTFKTCVILTATLLLCLLNVGFGWLTQSMLFFAGGLIGFCYVFLRIVYCCRTSRKPARRTRSAAVAPAAPVARPVRRDPIDPNDIEALVEQMLSQGRYALLLRSQIADNLDAAQFGGALEALEEAMALVPDGEVVLGQIDEALDDGKLDAEEIASAQGRVVKVRRFFLDRFPVTNRQFYDFVAGGGYEQMPLWEESIWPAVLVMVDRAGMPGPRHWRDGCFLPGEENHPVIGVSWYEACAYARWVGKRLPSDAEWVKAGSWPVSIETGPPSANSRIQRKYPWGDDMDRTRANLWGSGPNRIVPAGQFAEGVSVGGVYQLIGNVWEWTAGSFRNAELVLPTPMKSIRGGAFDTYFDNQATCRFQSGENPLKRKHNIGFRCAVGVCDLTLARSATSGGVATQQQPAAAERAAEEQAPIAEEVHA